jgi:integrase
MKERQNMSTILYWRGLQQDFLNFLEEKGYEKSSIGQYKSVIGMLVRYANAHERSQYTPQLGQEFLRSEERLDYLNHVALRSRRGIIRRLDEYFDGGNYSFAFLRAHYECPNEFSSEYDGFLRFLHKHGFKERTINQYRVFCVKLFQDFLSNGIHCWKKVNAKALTGAFERSTQKRTFVIYTKRLFRYLVSLGAVKHDYSGILPNVPYEKKIPSVYSDSEIQILLDRIDRSTVMGKRDYAVLLLALRLGLRASDIRLLKFINVDFEKAIIEFVQHKTENAQRLTLLPEVAEALRDYINNGVSVK